jgi:hypothetical protein
LVEHPLFPSHAHQPCAFWFLYGSKEPVAGCGASVFNIHALETCYASHGTYFVRAYSLLIYSFIHGLSILELSVPLWKRQQELRYNIINTYCNTSNYN